MRRLLTRWPPRFLRTPEAARVVGLSARTLEKHRSYGTGPRYRKFGGRISYDLADLKAWRMSALEKIPRILDPERYCQPRKFSLRGALARTRLLVRVASQQQLRLADRVLTLQHEARIT